MKAIIHNRPEPVLETLALLYISRQRDALMEFYIFLLEAQGLDVREDLTRHEDIHKKYTDAFSAERFDNEDSDFLFHTLNFLEYVMIVVCFLLDKELVWHADEKNKEELTALLSESYLFLNNVDVSVLADFRGNFSEYIASNDVLSAFVQDIERYFSSLAELVRRNIPAMENAWDCVRKEAQGFLLSTYQNPEEFYDKTTLAPDANVRHAYPQLSLYSSSFIVGDTYYYGLFNIDNRSEDERLDEKSIILTTCKALGDKNRVEILSLLREKPRYNREVAELLGLTAATALHHIDLLFSAGLIKMTTDSENQKRIYYELNQKHIERFAKALNNLLQ